jgi:hypothetical protein
MNFILDALSNSGRVNHPRQKVPLKQNRIPSNFIVNSLCRGLPNDITDVIGSSEDKDKTSTRPNNLSSVLARPASRVGSVEPYRGVRVAGNHPSIRATPYSGWFPSRRLRTQVNRCDKKATRRVPEPGRSNLEARPKVRGLAGKTLRHMPRRS